MIRRHSWLEFNSALRRARALHRQGAPSDQVLAMIAYAHDHLDTIVDEAKARRVSTSRFVDFWLQDLATALEGTLSLVERRRHRD